MDEAGNHMGADEAIEGVLMELSQDACLYERKSTDSKIAERLTVGDEVFVTDMEENWCTVWYDGRSVYVERERLKKSAADKELAEEMQELDFVTEQDMNESLRSEKQRQSALLWGSVIAVLIVLIFGIGIVTAFKEERKGIKGIGEGKEDDGGKENDEMQRF